MGRGAIAAAGVTLAALLVAGPAAGEPVPDRLREQLRLDRFYQKHADAGGLPVLGSARVTDHALAEAAWIVGRMLDGRDDIRAAMRAARVRVVVMAAGEYTTDVPEHARLAPKLYWDRRARGLGATPANPVVSCGEENILGYPGDPYPAENIFVHEFAHAIHGTGLNTVDPTFDGRLRAAYRAAVERGLWRNTYAATNHSEYWAEGVQCWFDDNAPPDSLHNDVRTRDRLRGYDPGLARLCEEVFADRPWRYRRPAERPAADRAHLPGYDPKALPRFRWRDAPLTDRPRVTVQTAAGDFEVELDAKAAPEACRAFLRVALDGGYHSGRFGRAVVTRAGPDGVPTIGRVVAAVNPAWLDRPGNALDRGDLPRSSARPGDGTIALTRSGRDRGEFVVCVGAVPDAADLAPFGRVTKGADVVRKVLAAPAENGTLTPPVDVRRVIRLD